ncbi:MAG: hypothetical protein NTW19_12210 [Planctomycetota bacterium]|nr:hypothetical protein [Planctomycetota bacterium]
MLAALRLLFPKRLGRRSYAIRLAAFMAATFVIALWLFVQGDSPNNALLFLARIPWFILIAPFVILQYGSILFPRLRDTGVHGPFMLVSVVAASIPGTSLPLLVILLFVPTDAFAPVPVPPERVAAASPKSSRSTPTSTSTLLRPAAEKTKTA